MKAQFEGRTSFGEARGTASDHYRRFAKAGVPGYVLDEDDTRRDFGEEDEFHYLFVWYNDLRNQEHRGQYFEPVSHSEILAYEAFLNKMGFELTAFDWDMLLQIDLTWRSVQPSPTGAPPPKPSGKGPTRH